MGTSPAGVVDLGGGWQFVVLEPFSEWLGVKATTTPAIATFHDGKRVSLDRHIPYFENVQSVLVTISPTGGHFVTIPRCQGSCRLSEMESGVGWGRKVDIRDEALLSRT